MNFSLQVAPFPEKRKKNTCKTLVHKHNLGVIYVNVIVYMGILIFETFVALVNLFFAEVLDSRSSSGSDRGGCWSAVLCASHHHGPGSAKYYRCAHRSLADRAVGLRCCLQAGTRPESCVPFGAVQLESTCSWHPSWDAERKREITSSFVTRAPVPDPMRGSAPRDAGRVPQQEGSRRGRTPPGSRFPDPGLPSSPPSRERASCLPISPRPPGSAKVERTDEKSVRTSALCGVPGEARSGGRQTRGEREGMCVSVSGGMI